MPVFLWLWCSTFLYFMAIGMLIPTLPRYVAGPLHGDALDVGVAVVAFSIASVLVRPPLGRVADRWPRRNLVIFGALLVAVGCGVLAVPAFDTVLLSRVVSGVGDALFLTAATATVYDIVPRARSGAAVSYFTVAVYFGLMLGPVVGETLWSADGFRTVWLVAAALAFISAASSGILPGSKAAPGPHPVVTTDARPRRPVPRPREALVPRGAWAPAAMMVLSTFGAAGFSSFAALYASHLGQATAAPDFVALASTTLLVRLGAAGLVDRISPWLMAGLMSGGSGAGLVVIAAVRTPSGLLGGAVLLGAGQALSLPVLLALALARTDPARRTAVIAVVTAGYDVGFGLAASALGVVLDAAGFAAMFFVAGAGSIAGLMPLMFARPADRRVRLTPDYGKERTS